MKKQQTFCTLFTKEAENIGDVPHQSYPRPQLKRNSFFNLNGVWGFCVKCGTEVKYSGEIVVPFVPQSALSGVYKNFEKGDVFIYTRTFSLSTGFIKDRVILHIGAADQETEVVINGHLVGTNAGGYLPFSFDITEHLLPENEIIITVRDNGGTVLPYGKQREKRGGMWYTQVSGIWQTVWCESVPNEYVRSLKITTKGNKVKIKAKGVTSGTVTVASEQFGLVGGECEFEVKNPQFWSPETPHLYYFKIVAGADEVESYFALRDLEIKTVNGLPRLTLNGNPYFFNGLLDQGYFSDGIFTPADLSLFEEDVLAAKKLGFNMLRKHIKIEPEQFYYDCDRLGMIVFQDMVNNGDYNFIRDTALPTINFKKRNDKRLNRDKNTREAFLSAMDKTVEHLYNHPSICLWTIFNEGWGQFNSTEAYHRLKKLDNTRFIDSASGWFVGGESDVYSEHIYFKPYKFQPHEKPTILSEFGGYALQIEGHVFNPEKQYGYRAFKDSERLTAEIVNLYETQVIPAAKNGLCAAVYTQLTDIEDETNGLITYDRKVLKVKKEQVFKVMNKLKNCNFS